MELISENVGSGETGEGDEVPDRQYSGLRLSDISERGRTGPTTQLQPLHGYGVSAQRLPEGSPILPWAQDTPPSFSAWTSDDDTGKQYFRGFWVRRTKAGQTGRASQLVDLRVNVETC